MKWLWRRQKYEEVDPLDFLRRAQAIQARMERVHARASRADRALDVETIEAAEREAELLLDNLREIRLEQIEAERNGFRKPVES